MAGEDFKVTAKLVADNSDFDAKAAQSASRWESAAQRMQQSSRSTTGQLGQDASRAGNAWSNAAARMTGASGRFASQTSGHARQAGSVWQDAAGKWRNSAGQFASAADMAAAGMSHVGSASRAAGGGMNSGAMGAAKLAANLFLIVGAAGAAGAALAALPALASAVGGIGSVVGGAFFGVGDAIRGYIADQKSASAAGGAGASAAAAHARAIRDAYKQIDRARQNAARVARDGAERVEAAARRVEDAERALARSARNVQDALREEQRAQQDLDDARRDAIRTLDELQERVSDLALDQEGAAIAVAEAEKAYQRELVSTESTELSRRKALYDLNVAKERQSDLERESTQAIEENTEAQAKGVDGSDQVVDAQERLEQASRSVEDAREAERMAARDVRDAETELARTKRDVAEANADAADQVADALEGLKDAQDQANQSMGGGAGAASKFAEAMKKLTPEGRDFVNKLIEMGKLLKGLSNTAQKAFLPGLTQMLEDSKDLFPLFDAAIMKTGTLMGEQAKKFGTMFKDTGFQKDLAAMMDNANLVIGPLGDGILNLSRAWVRLGANQELSAAAGRLIEGLFNGLVGLLDTLNANAPVFAEALRDWADVFEWLLPLAGELLAWAAEMDPTLWLVIGGLRVFVPLLLKLLAFRKLSNLLSVAKDIDSVGDAADRNKGKVRSFFDTLRGKDGGGVDVDLDSPDGKDKGKSKGPGGKLLGGMGSAVSRFGPAGVAAATHYNGLDETLISGDLDKIPEQVKNGMFMQFFGTDLPNWWNGLWGESGFFSTALSGLPGKAGEWFGGLYTSATTWLTDTWTSAKQRGSEIVSGIGQWLGSLPGRAGQWFGGLLTSGRQKLTDLWTTGKQKASETVSGIGQWLSTLPARAGEWFMGMVRAAQDRGAQLLQWARDLPGRILSGLGNLGRMLWNSGVELISGFWDGLVARWNQLMGWVRSAMADLRSYWPFSPAKQGPFSGKGYVTYSGEALTRDWAASLRAGMPGVIASARAVTDAARAQFAPGLAASLPPVAGPAGTGTTVIHYHTHVHVGGSVIAERELLDLVQRGSATFADRNTSTGLVGRK